MAAAQGIMGNAGEGQNVSGIKVTHSHHELAGGLKRREESRARDRRGADRQLIGGGVIWAAR